MLLFIYTHVVTLYTHVFIKLQLVFEIHFLKCMSSFGICYSVVKQSAVNEFSKCGLKTYAVKYRTILDWERINDISETSRAHI